MRQGLCIFSLDTKQQCFYNLRRLDKVKHERTEMRSEVKVKIKPKAREEIVTLSNYLPVGTKAERQLQIIREVKEFNRWTWESHPEMFEALFDYEIIED